MNSPPFQPGADLPGLVPSPRNEGKVVVKTGGGKEKYLGSRAAILRQVKH